jgi:peptide/nickel transport system substrate-binding protein
MVFTAVSTVFLTQTHRKLIKTEKKFTRGVISNAVSIDFTKLSLIQVRDMAFNIYEGLLQMDCKTGLIKPCLAESYEISEDLKTYVFNLKKGVKFHDGRPFTSEDVKFSIERVLDPKTASWQSTNLMLIKGARDFIDGNSDKVSGVELLDDFKIKITNNKTLSAFPYYIGILLPVYPKFACSEAGDKWGTKTIIGTGPFFVENYDVHQGCKMKRFEDYHEDKPIIDSLDFKFYGDNGTMMLEFESGDIDLVFLGDEIADQYIKNEKFAPLLHSFDEMAIYYIVPNVKCKPWDNKKIREAFSYAVDVEAICGGYSKGKIVPAATLTIPGVTGYNENAEIRKYDPEKSLQILAEAGVEIPVKIDWPVSSLRNWSGKITIAIQDQAKKAGFEIDVHANDTAVWAHLRSSGKLPIGIGSRFLNFPSLDDFFYNIFHSKKSINYSSNYNNSEFDKILDDARTTFDKNIQKKLYQEADLILRNDFAAIPIGYPRSHYMIQPRVKNFEIKNMIFPFKYCDVK